MRSNASAYLDLHNTCTIVLIYHGRLGVSETSGLFCELSI